MKAAAVMTTRALAIDSFTTMPEAIVQLAALEDTAIHKGIALEQDTQAGSSSAKSSENNARGIIAKTDVIYKTATKDIVPENIVRLFAETGIRGAPVTQEQFLCTISATNLFANFKITLHFDSNSLTTQ